MFLDEAALWSTQPNTATWRTTWLTQYREILGKTTGAEVIAFVDALASVSTRRCPTVVVMDRASVHTCKAVAKCRASWKKRGLMVVYLPPYSPELNPMEGKWRLLKDHKLAVHTQTNKQQVRLAVGPPTGAAPFHPPRCRASGTLLQLATYAPPPNFRTVGKAGRPPLDQNSAASRPGQRP